MNESNNNWSIYQTFNLLTDGRPFCVTEVNISNSFPNSLFTMACFTLENLRQYVLNFTQVNKGGSEPRPRGANNSNSRASRGGADRTSRSSSVQSVSCGAGKINVCIHWFSHLYIVHFSYIFLSNQITWLQGLQYWDLVSHQAIPLRS